LNSGAWFFFFVILDRLFHQVIHLSTRVQNPATTSDHQDSKSLTTPAKKSRIARCLPTRAGLRRRDESYSVTMNSADPVIHVATLSRRGILSASAAVLDHLGGANARSDSRGTSGTQRRADQESGKECAKVRKFHRLSFCLRIGKFYRKLKKIKKIRPAWNRRAMCRALCRQTAIRNTGPDQPCNLLRQGSGMAGTGHSLPGSGCKHDDGTRHRRLGAAFAPA